MPGPQDSGRHLCQDDHGGTAVPSPAFSPGLSWRGPSDASLSKRSHQAGGEGDRSSLPLGDPKEDRGYWSLRFLLCPDLAGEHDVGKGPCSLSVPGRVGGWLRGPASLMPHGCAR